MSLVPMLFSKWWEDLDRPHRITDQHFGHGLKLADLMYDDSPDTSLIVVRPDRRHHLRGLHYHPYERSLLGRKSGGTSTLQADKDNFKVNLDVQQFSPEEINVKVVGRNVVIEGKHEEKQDEHGSISRHFIRKYMVPEQCDIDALQSNLSSDGVLSIIAPRKQALEDKQERVIPIQRTGEPAVVDSEMTNGSNSSDGKEGVGSRTPSTRRQEKAKLVKAA